MVVTNIAFVPTRKMDDVPQSPSAHRALGRLWMPVGRNRSNSIAKQHKLGLETLNPGVNSPTANIVFVHGLGGNRELTWCYQRNVEYFWPKKWLPNVPGLTKCLVHTFGYDANWATFKDTTAGIVDFAKRLNLELFTSGLDNAPIVFLAHSMGGLVVKKAFMLARQDKNYDNLSEKMSLGAFFFLATPHRGASSARLLQRVLSVTIGPKPIVQELTKNSGTIDSINEDFRHYAESLRLFSLHETQPMSIGGFSKIIVDKNSATLGYQNELSCHIDANHHTICKYKDQSDPGYDLLRKLLIKVVSDLELPAYSPSVGMNTPVFAPSKDLVKLLGTGDAHEEDLLTFRDLRMRESCQWVENKEGFRWLLTVENQLYPKYLWLKAHPAMGKSVLMSYIIDHLCEEDQPCTYYFFRFNNARKRTTRAFLLSSALQFANMLPQYYAHLVQHVDETSKITLLSNRILWQKLFADALFDIEWPKPCFWVIDALDEAENPAEIISYLGKIRETTGLRVLVTSRHDNTLARDFGKLRLAPKLFKEELLGPEDTLRDIVAYTERQLESFPIGREARMSLVQQIATKAQGLFLWVTLALDKVLSEAHFDSDIREALEEVPTEMSELFSSILENMSRTTKGTKVRLAQLILQNVICCFRPLTITELASTLRPEFGELFNIEHTIKSLCPHLLKVNEHGQIQPIHQTVRDFLLNDPPSEFGVNSLSANKSLGALCLKLWIDQGLLRAVHNASKKSMITTKSLDGIHPLFTYASTFWYRHLEEAEKDEELMNSLKIFLKASILDWMEVIASLQRLHHLTQAGRSLQNLVEQCVDLESPHLKTVAQWAVDLLRITPKFGRNILEHPSSIHTLLPAFCPSETAIGSQFGSETSIRVVGSSVTKWDDCLAHFTVGGSGNMCKAIVCGSRYTVISLSGSQGTIIVYSSDTCQEERRMHSGRRISCIALDGSGEQLASGSVQSIQIWDIYGASVLLELRRERSAKCLSVGFRNGNHVVVSVAADNTITLWDTRTGEPKTSKFDRAQSQGNENRHRGAPWCVALNEDCTKVALAYKGWPLEIWDIDAHRLLTVINTGNPVSAAFSPANDVVYATGMDGTLTRFDIYTGLYQEVDAQAHSIACNSIGTVVALGNGEGCVELRDAETLTLQRRLDKYDDSVINLAFSSDDQRLYDVRSSDCNVWAPDALIGSLKEELRNDPAHAASTNRTLQSISALACSARGDYVCCAKAKGKVFIYDTNGGREVRKLYEHASTVTIRALYWSTDGSLIASGDDAGRVLVYQVAISDSVEALQWRCALKQDIRLDSRVDQGIHQLLISDDGERLLVSSNKSDRMFSLGDGSEVGQRKVRATDQKPSWIAHPSTPDCVVEMTLSHAKSHSWAFFQELSCITLKGSSELRGIENQGALHVNKSFITQDRRFIVSSVSPSDKRANSTYCSFWSTADLEISQKPPQEAHEMSSILVHRLLGIFENKAVFLDRDLCVCTMAAAAKHFDKHFYLPFDWLDISEDRPSAVSTLGELVAAHHGEVLIVKGGMNCRLG